MRDVISLHALVNYIGPGLGGGIISAVIGFFTSIFLALFAILWYPFKRIIKKFKDKESDEISTN